MFNPNEPSPSTAAPSNTASPQVPSMLDALHSTASPGEPRPLGGLNLGHPSQPWPFSQGLLERRPLPESILAILAKPVSAFKSGEGTRSPTGQPPLTQIAFVLDGSSSMESGKSATVEGFNSQLAVVKEGATQAGDTRFTYTWFSSFVEVKQLGVALTEAQPLTLASYPTHGMTALFDAIGRTVAALLETPGIQDPNTAVLVTIFTDGENNQVKDYNVETIRALIERLEATGRWTFALVGPNSTVTGLAATLAVSKDNVVGFDVSSVADKLSAFSKVSAASATYMSLRSMGETQVKSLYSESDAK